MRGLCELTLESRDHGGPVEHDGGDHSLYFEDPEGNVVEVWDFYEDGQARR